MTEIRRILLDGYPIEVVRDGEELVAPDGRRIAIEAATHLAPSEPTKIIAVHLNYDSRTQEFMTKLPPAPTYFHKPITALNTHKGAVVRPAGCKWLNYEGEIVIIIGKTCRNISPAEAGEYIAGYSVGNDYGLHDFRDTDAGSMLRVKGSDTLAPVGPGMVTDWDFRNKMIRTYVTVRSSKKTTPTTWSGTCTTWWPTLLAPSLWCRATCCSRALLHSAARFSLATLSRLRSRVSAA